MVSARGQVNVANTGSRLRATARPRSVRVTPRDACGNACGRVGKEVIDMIEPNKITTNRDPANGTTVPNVGIAAARPKPRGKRATLASAVVSAGLTLFGLGLATGTAHADPNPTDVPAPVPHAAFCNEHYAECQTIFPPPRPGKSSPSTLTPPPI
jgi:hypothetical protein